MEERVKKLLESWQKRNIQGFYCGGKDEATEEVLRIIPVSASVGISGSVTLDSLGIAKKLQARGTKVFNQYKPGISRQENLELRRQGATADYYLASANAVSCRGELVFFSGYGNRTAGISYAANAIVVCGINKLTSDLAEALKRAREYATPLNCKRLGWQAPCFKDGICRQEICFAPDYKRMCSQVLIVENEVTPGRLKVILVGENLGF
ncbi:MAG: lactate utilization protein [Candidatus Omnitrophota bacterium]